MKIRFTNHLKEKFLEGISSGIKYEYAFRSSTIEAILISSSAMDPENYK